MEQFSSYSPLHASENNQIKGHLCAPANQPTSLVTLSILNHLAGHCQRLDDKYICVEVIAIYLVYLKLVIFLNFQFEIVVNEFRAHTLYC